MSLAQLVDQAKEMRWEGWKEQPAELALFGLLSLICWSFFFPPNCCGQQTSKVVLGTLRSDGWPAGDGLGTQS